MIVKLATVLADDGITPTTEVGAWKWIAGLILVIVFLILWLGRKN